MVRPFRFAGGLSGADSAAEWADGARRIESLGYDLALTGDHFLPGRLAPVPALVAAALATRTLRVGCTVFANDFRHPAVLAMEAATIDVLSGGRLEFGIGAGYNMTEYRRVGIPFDPPAVRVSRMEEGLRVIKGIWADGPYTFAGRHYSISEYDGWPKPIQRPHPPVFIGAGSKRLLSFAAREADIVGIVAPARSDSDHVDREGDTDARLTEQVRWVRDAAGARFGSLELAMLVWGVAVTSDRSAAAGQLAVERQMTTDQVLASPAFLIGSVDAIAERLLEQRERHGISHISVFPQHVEPFAPVVARLAGQ